MPDRRSSSVSRSSSNSDDSASSSSTAASEDGEGLPRKGVGRGVAEEPAVVEKRIIGKIPKSARPARRAAPLASCSRHRCAGSVSPTGSPEGAQRVEGVL